MKTMNQMILKILIIIKRFRQAYFRMRARATKTKMKKKKTKKKNSKKMNNSNRSFLWVEDLKKYRN